MGAVGNHSGSAQGDGMNTPSAPPVPGVPQASDNVGGTHIAVVSIGVIIFVSIILIEIAGMNHTAAIAVGFLFLSVIFIAGMTHQGKLNNLTQYPAIP